MNHVSACEDAPDDLRRMRVFLEVRLPPLRRIVLPSNNELSDLDRDADGGAALTSDFTARLGLSSAMSTTNVPMERVWSGH